MTTETRLNRINELVDHEKAEQQQLREEFLENLRFGFRNMVEGLKVVDEENNDVTPENLKQIQKEKGFHNR